MDRTTPMGGSHSGAGSGADPASAKIEDVAQTAHQTTDRIADKAALQVDRLSGTAHRAVDSAADAASSAAEWASAIPEQAKQVQTRLTEAASASIRLPLSPGRSLLVIWSVGSGTTADQKENEASPRS